MIVFAGLFIGFGAVFFAVGTGSATAQTAPTPGLSPPLSSAEARDAGMFVVDRMFAADATLAELAALYDDEVDYYNRGVLPRVRVLSDKRLYLSRWPNRRYEPEVETLRVARIGGRNYAVSVIVRFEVSNGDERVTGRSRVAVELARRETGFRISSETETIINRE